MPDTPDIANVSPVSAPPETLSRQELKLVAELALAAPATIAQGIGMTNLMLKVQKIVNGPYDLKQDI